MSLLAQAYEFGKSESKGKMTARMQNTYKNIQQESDSYREPENMQSTSAMEKDIQANNQKVERILEKLTMKSVPQPEEAGDHLQDFKIQTPPNVPKLNTFQEPPTTKTTSETIGIKREGFMNAASIHKQRGSSYNDSYAPTPYYKGLSLSGKPGTHTTTSMNNSHSPSQLMEKLNYMIHLLEEQQKEPTQNIMEEFVLYGLLGVFMIYLVDSFARAGKYIR